MEYCWVCLHEKLYTVMKLSSWISTIPENMQLSSNNDFCLGCSYRKWQTTNQQAEFYFLPHCKYCGDERTWDWGTKIHLTCCPIDLFHIYIYMAGNWNGISTMECIFYIICQLHCGYQGSIWILWPQSWTIVLSYPSASHGGCWRRKVAFWNTSGLRKIHFLWYL